MRKHSCSCIAALGFLFYELARLKEQLSKVKEENTFKTQTHVIIGKRQERSRTAEEEIITDKLSYDNLCKKLFAAIVIWEKQRHSTGLQS